MTEADLKDRLKSLVEQSHALRKEPRRLALLKADAYDLSRQPNQTDTDKVMLEVLNVIIETAEEPETNGEVSNGKTT